MESDSHHLRQVIILTVLFVAAGWTPTRGDVASCPLSDYKWREVTAEAPFSPRDGAGALVYHDRIWLLGGWTRERGGLNEVWSSADGATWQRVTAEAPWPGRHGAGFVVFRDRMWVISGDGYPDVWSSDDGIHWDQSAANAPWGPRYAPFVCAFHDKLWLMGGIWWDNAAVSTLDSMRTFNDVWSSADGIHWQLVIPHASWSPRGLVHGQSVFRNRMWIIGGGTKAVLPGGSTGETIAEYADAWSSADGLVWRLETRQLPFKPRTHFSTGVYDDRLWLTDGSVSQQAALSNEVWTSLDGKHWEELPNTPWPARHASSVFTFDGSLWITSGLYWNDIWRMEPHSPEPH